MQATPSCRRSRLLLLRHARLAMWSSRWIPRQPPADLGPRRQSRRRCSALTDALGGLDVQLVFYRGFRRVQGEQVVLTLSAGLLRAITGVFCLAGKTQIGRVLQ